MIVDIVILLVIAVAAGFVIDRRTKRRVDGFATVTYKQSKEHTRRVERTRQEAHDLLVRADRQLEDVHCVRRQVDDMLSRPEVKRLMERLP